MTLNQIQKKTPSLCKNIFLILINTKIPGDESLMKFRNRKNKPMEKILAQEKGTLAIIAHAGVNRIIICNLLKLPFSYSWQVKQDIGAINI